MYYFSDLFDRVFCMFRTCPLSNIRSISTLYKQLQVFVMLVMLTVCQRDHVRRRQQNQNDKYLSRVYSIGMLLIMDSGYVRKTQSTLSNKFEKQCISLAFIIRITRLISFQVLPFKTPQRLCEPPKIVFRQATFRSHSANFRNIVTV